MTLHHHTNAAGLHMSWHSHGALHRVDAHGVMVNLFPGNVVEGGPANLWLRRISPAGADVVPLLGPLSPLQPIDDEQGFTAQGTWAGLQLHLQLRLANDTTAWFWHLQVANTGTQAQTVDLISVQDTGLSPYGSTRLNEHYVSHYVDLSPLAHATRGWMVAARQNLAVAGRHPWLLMGALGHASAYATDALQVQGLAARAGALPQGVVAGLPGTRLQHEHALIALQQRPVVLAPGESRALGFFGLVLADHPQATQDVDVAIADTVLQLPQCAPPAAITASPAWSRAPAAPSLFASAPWLSAQDLSSADIDMHFGADHRHAETEGGTLLSFFSSHGSHVVLREKELRTQRPHGHILRTGRHLVPDEAALTSTVWMAGVFHSMVTQGHVSINRFLSTARGWLGQYRSTGQRIFVHLAGRWQQLGVPSAFEIEPDACRWLYKHAEGLIEVRSSAGPAHTLALRVRALQGPPLRLRVVHHVALAGDDGLAAAGPALARPHGRGLWVGVPEGSELAARFPQGGFAITPGDGCHFAAWGGDELLWADGLARGEPFICVDSAETRDFALHLSGHLVEVAPVFQGELSAPQWQPPGPSLHGVQAQRLADFMPWALHNALVHYLAPRGLEQYSGGGWGTRDVCQGPLEMLLALGHTAPVRDLLQRVFSAQDTTGDWPQWFMFFERERDIRAGDSHGDIVFWPLVALARYLLATADTAFLDQPLPFHAAQGAPAEQATLWQHVQRALAVVQARRIPGTHLAAYGHGDWNDSLQPANPALREQMCSAWTVTLHHQMLTLMARALRAVGRPADAAPLQAEAAEVKADFQRLLMPGGVVAGYALFPPGEAPRMLLHPQDDSTGVHYSLLPMMHAVLEDMLSPAQVRSHMSLMRRHLVGPDGAHLFDRPMPYRGGPQTLFQRAESSAFFGREIGNMYMHAHLRWAEMLAHLGEAGMFLEALALAHPVALRELVPQASLRQANCYYSSSDPAFADRHAASHDYADVAAGRVALDGGWRVYSSGPGIAIGLVVGCLLGFKREHDSLVFDPVMPMSLSGLRTQLNIAGQNVAVRYQLGPRGCGVSCVELNGAALPFKRRANPYRTGAAVVPLQAAQALLREQGNELVLHTA